jgi:anti-anti-sigma factor
MSEDLAKVDVRRTDGRVVISVSGEIDMSNVDELGRAIDDAVVDATSLIIDLRSVDYMDSQGIRGLHDISRRLAKSSVDLVVVAPRHTVAGELLRLTSLDAMIRVTDSPPDT